MSVNKVFLKGRLGQDPQDNNGVVKFSLATSEKYTDKQGQKVEDTQWHNCVSFGKTAETLLKWLKKGEEVFIEGKIKYNKYEDKIYTNIIVVSFDFISVLSNKSESPVKENTDNAPNLPDEPDDLPF